MEQGQIRCDNIGMTQDTSISALGKGQDGVTNYAFENHNIRVLAVNDNTKFAVTNEKSTKYEGSLFGTFIGGCKLNHYVVLFTKDRNPNNATPDYIYRLDYDGTQVNVLQLYNGNLNFSFDNAIEALGFYESEEIQKVYWVDGVNQNRFINIMTDATVRAGWNDYSFDFQGHIQSIPTVTVEKNYQKAGYFPAGTMQYFISYYNKYGVETCLVWASDLQYCSLSSRGAKADESVSCGFDFKITNIDTNYDFLRIYSCYRSGLNGAVTANIVIDISLAGKSSTDVLVYTDLNSNLTGFDSNDIPYVGGQSIIANTLDYKQDTLFLGDIRLPDNSSIDVEFYKESVTIPDLRDANKQAVAIMSSKAISWVYKQVSDDVPVGVYSYKSELRDSQEEIAGFKWREVYRFGIQFMTPTGEWTSAYWIGDKYCDCPPTKIMSEALTESYTGVIGVNGTYYRILAAGAPTTWIDAGGNIIYSALHGVTMMTPMYSDRAMTTQIGTVGSVGNTIKFPILPDAHGIIKCSNYLGTNRTVKVFYKSDGSYIANAVVDFTKLCSGNDRTYLQNNFIAYRLLVADMDITSRRIVEQGVISPTMFNYADRYYNRPYSIPSWMFRPRVAPGTTTAPINRHYDTLPKQTESNAELQGIMKKSVPGFDKTAHEGDYNAYMLIFGANDGGSYIKWKLIYYNAGPSDQDKINNLNKIMEVDSGGKPVNSAVFGGNYAVVSSGYIKEAAGKWDKVQGGFVSELTSDVKSKGFDVVLSPAMLPSGGMMKSIAYQKGSAAAVFAVLATVIIAVAAAVASVFTCGAAAAAGAAAIAALATATVTTAVTMSVLTSVLSMVAIAGMAATAAIAQKMDDFKEIDKEMAAKGFLPINIDGHELSNRRNTPHQITEMLKRMFTVTIDGGWATLKNSAQGFNDWTVPFTNDPSTYRGALGEDYNAYVISGPLTFLSAEEEDLKNKQNMFCTDESIVTLNAPDIEDNVYTIDNSEAFNLDLVGIIPVEAAHGEYTMQCTPGLNNSAQVIPNKFVDNPLYTTNILGLVNGNFYQDCHITEASMKGAGIPETRLPDMQVVATTALYKQWMWNRETTASLWAPGLTLKSAIDESKLTTPAARIERKLFANLRYSSDTAYYDPHTMEIESPVVCLDSQAMLKAFRFNGDNKFYYENVDTISTYNHPYTLVVAGAEWPVIEDNDLIGKANITDPVHIKYRQAPHILLPFKAKDGVHTILPYTAQEQPLTPAQLYGDDLGNIKLAGISFAGTSWNQVQLPWYFGAVPYMFMGELVKKVFDYGTWMGGTGNYGLQQLVWNVASKAAPVGTFLKQSWGDTFYQRWDCQKTYPYTEDDKNSIVDVLSFMLESHDNLDGRCDINRGLNNLLNLRPMNTIFNRNYSQKDNFFTYKVLDEKFNKKHFEADVLWSLTKNNVDDIDRWTCLVSTNEMPLDGRYGVVRKILNVNDVLVAFQDSAITDIRYNENAALATTSGLPLQMGNTGKVDGYRVISDTTGCHNKFSISKNSAGVFYIDDYNKSFNRFTLNGGNEDLGMRAEFSRWFKNPKNLSGSIWSANSNNAFRASYDEITHDLYLIRDNQCIVFNTLLNKFTSFMDYVDTPLITNMISGNGKSETFAFRNTYNNARQRIVEIWEMFGGADPTSPYGPQGEYGYIYGQFRPYSMEYRLSPDPLHDSIFANYIYSADWTDPTKDVDEYDIFDTSARRYTTFDTVEAKNEHQQGIIKMDTQRIGRWPVKSKFRIWRGDIPRNGDTLTGHIYAGDRMRNPWIHLKFEKNNADDSKMTFHDLTVIYYNQYGRI